ncbi:MAG: xanthine dehydrogenase family protein subunit M [Candidatus Limnocylindria bacterium]
MIPGEFDYTRPGDLGTVLKVLKDRGGEAKLLAGGHSLLPLLKFRLAAPEVLVDLRGIPGLDMISEVDGELRIGGLATHRQILDHEIIARYPMLHDTAGGIGDPQVRNWGTIGGSCAHADPASDWPAVLLAAHASIVCRSQDGERVIVARDFFLDTFSTAIEPTEILTEIRFPKRPSGAGGAYCKLERRAGDFASVGVAARLRLADGKIADAGLGLTAVADTPFAATDAEAILIGADPSDEAFAAAAAAAAAQSRPTTDGHGPAEYKRAMVVEITNRALRIALERATANA